MQLRSAGLLLLLAGCGGAVASNDDPNDSGAPTTITYDGGLAKGPPSPIADAGIFTPIDTSQWRTDGTCSFKWIQYGNDLGPPVTIGTREVAFIAGTEIPYLVFGCSATEGNTTVTFLGGTLTDPSDAGTSNPQWALLDLVVDDPDPTLSFRTSYWVDDANIWKCNLTESSTSFGTIGSSVSGSFSCGEMPGTDHNLAQVSEGVFNTALSAPAAFTLP